MSQIVLPYELQANTPEDVQQLMANLNTLLAAVNSVSEDRLEDGVITEQKLAPVIQQLLLPVGGMVDYAGVDDLIPNKIVVCDGRALNRLAFPTLFARIGTRFGAGDNSTTFNIPSLTDQRYTAGVVKDQVGTKFGANAHALTQGQLPAHSHAVNDPGHSHGMTPAGSHNHGTDDGSRQLLKGALESNNVGNLRGWTPGGQEAGQSSFSKWQMWFIPHTGTVGDHSHGIQGAATGIGLGNTGANEAHENRPLSVGVTKLIRIA